MDNPKQNPNPNPNPNPATNPDSPPAEEGGEEAEPESEIAPRPPSSRRPFTSLSQVDADRALARTLQEQERAYMMLRMGAIDGSEYATSDGGSEYEDYLVDDRRSIDESDYNDDAFDAHVRGSYIDPASFSNDEAYAREIQESEEWEEALRLMALAGINEWTVEDREDHGSQEAWLEVDPDDLSYEELVALGEAVGTESRGLSADTIASLPSVKYKARSAEDGNNDQCVICRLDYEDGDSLVFLACKHTYHSECINKWLQINKVCPVCSAEVSISENSVG